MAYDMGKVSKLEITLPRQYIAAKAYWMSRQWSDAFLA